jgi:hypothetical protein
MSACTCLLLLTSCFSRSARRPALAASHEMKVVWAQSHEGHLVWDGKLMGRLDHERTPDTAYRAVVVAGYGTVIMCEGY